MRERVSLLLSEGHASARHYPLAMVGVESEIVRRRINNRMVTESTLMQACISTIMNGREGSRHYNTMIKELNRG